MKLLFTKILCLISITIFLAGCEKKELPVPTEQEILFEVSYINFAWGKQHNGFLIDKDGNIKEYQNPAEWNFLSDEEGISQAQINANLTKTTLSTTKIPVDELKEYASKIYTIDSKKLSKAVSGGADMGAIIFAAYLYNSETQTYSRVMISQSGDWQSKNTDKPAREINDWLTEVKSRIK